MKFILVALTPVALYGLISGSQETVVWFLRGTDIEPALHSLYNGNSIFFNVSVGYLVSLFFWLIVVYLPERRRKNIIKNNLKNSYKNFKENIIQILLWASIGTHDSELPKELCDYKKFKEFFGKNRDELWYAALNGLQFDQTRMNDLLIEIEMLANEVAYTLNNVMFTDPKIHSFFKLLLENVYRLKNSSTYTYDQVKYVGNFLWGILAQWSFIDGQREEDIIQKMIERI